MLKFIGKRVLMLIPVLIGVSLIVFTLMQLSPGDPAMIILGAQAAPVSSGDDLAAELIKGNKLKKLGWLLNAALPALHKKDGTEAGETVRNAILVSYCELGRIGRSDTAAQLAAELDSGDLEKLALKVYDIWYADGAQSKHKWVLPFACVYGGAAITARQAAEAAMTSAAHIAD